MKRRVLIIGLDGATFDIIGPMVRRGKLPNIARLMENGAYGKLKSTVPPLTSIAWSSMITGKNAGKHGIVDFRRLNRDHKIEYVNGSCLKEKTVFEMANEAGLRCVVINVPMTYPPKKINGTWISGMDAPQSSTYTYPASLAKKLNSEGYLIDLVWGLDHFRDKDLYLQDLLSMTSKRETVALDLLGGQWDLAMVVFVLPDRAQHFLWDSKKLIEKAYGEADSSVGRLIRQNQDATVLIVSDHGAGPAHTGFSINKFLYDEGFLHFIKPEILDEITDWRGRGGSGFIVGKSGKLKLEPMGPGLGYGLKSKFGEMLPHIMEHALKQPKPEPLNELTLSLKSKDEFAGFFIRLGKLKKIRLDIVAKGSKEGIGLQIGGVNSKIQASTFLSANYKRYSFILNTESVEVVFTTYGIMPTGEMSIRKVTVSELSGDFEPSASSVDMTAFIDWQRTKAYAFGCYGSIYLNETAVPYGEREELAAILGQKLLKLKNPLNEENLIASVHRKKDLFTGQAENCPDLVALPSDGYYPVDESGSLEESILCPVPRLMNSCHRLEGIIIAGNDTFKKHKIDQADIVDIVPTVLTLLGLPVPDDMDGEVIDVFQDVLRKKIKINSLKTKKEDSLFNEAESKLIEARLKGLGYID